MRRVKVKDMQKKTVKRYIIISLVVMVSALFIYWKFFRQDKASLRDVKADTEPIHIAMAAPLSGDSASVGRAFRQGISLYIDAINEKEGGIKGRKVILDMFDDENDQQKAKKVALEIKEQNQAVAVIGHHYSTCSIAAGEIYKEYGIPALTPVSTNIRVTQGNNWYFRTCFNDRLQGQFLANYAKTVLGINKVSIIMDSDYYGKDLSGVFVQTAKKLKLDIVNIWEFNTKDPKIDDRLEEIVGEVTADTEANAIFLPVHTKEGVKLMIKIKDILTAKGTPNKFKILVPDSFTEAFQREISKNPKEKQQPGYYTDDIYVATPLLSDATNEKGQKFQEMYQKRYNEKPGWHASFAYDTAMILVKAIKDSEIKGLPKTLPDDRGKIRDYLATINTTTAAIEGVTGYNYFDKNRDSQKAIYMGIYRKGIIVSALIQYQTIISQDGRDAGVKPGQEGGDAGAKFRVVFGDKNMYQTNVIYTGIEIKEITELDVIGLQCTIDFFIWFRYQGDIDVKKIEFINVAASTDVKKPSIEMEKVFEKPGQLGYSLYHVKGRFKADFLEREKAYNQHVLGISFRHPDLDRNNLIYVTDVLGMGTSNTGTSSDDIIADRLITNRVLNPSTGWKINRAVFFQDLIRQSSKGNPDYLNVQQGTVEFSRFNAGIVIDEDKFNLRGLIHRKATPYILVISFVLLIIVTLISDMKQMKSYTKTIWFIQSFLWLLILLTSEIVTTDWVAAGKNNVYIKPTVIGFQMIWWILPALLIRKGVDRFIWKPLEERTGRVVPNVIRRFLLLIIYIMVIFGIVAFVFDQKLTSLLATSGVFAMIIGLAIQMNISNIFSGIAINIERPFRIGDWVKIQEYPEGKVVDINWRTTRIQTRDDTTLSIPNYKASESPVENFSFPNPGYWQYVTVHVDAIHPPERVKKILLDAALSSKFVSKDPAPFTRFLGLTSGITKLSESWAANYLLCLFYTDYGKKFAYNEDVWLNLWKHFRRANIRIVLPRQETHFFLEGVRRKSERFSKSLMTLQELEIFRPFSVEAKEYLSKKVRLHHYLPGETIVQQGDRGKSLFIVEEGVVGIWVKFDDNPETPMGVEVARMGAGNFFGEMALLTGEARTASIISITETNLYEITKNDIAPFLEREPEITRLLSNILTERKMATESQKSQSQSQKIDKATLYEQMLGKIQSFFGFK